MREDILEQLVDDYLQLQGYFFGSVAKHNIKFRPRTDRPDFVNNQDSNHSDIDAIGFNPKLSGSNRIWVVSCKSWRSGFSVQSKLSGIKEDKIDSGRESWKAFRELVKPKWTEAFFTAVKEHTGSTKFVYVTAATVIHGDRRLWERHPPFRKAMKGNPLKLLELREMLNAVMTKLTTTVAASELGRTLQLLTASGCLARNNRAGPKRAAVGRTDGPNRLG